MCGPGQVGMRDDQDVIEPFHHSTCLFSYPSSSFVLGSLFHVLQPFKRTPRLPTLPGHGPCSPPIGENIYFLKQKKMKLINNREDIVLRKTVLSKLTLDFSLFWMVWRLENKHFVSVRPRQVVRRSWWLNCSNCLFIWNIFGRIVSLKASLSPLH